MIIHNEFSQGSEGWHKMKWGKIGGSLADGLLGKSDTLFIDIFSQHSEEFQLEDNYISDDMERGTELEPEAIKRLEQYLQEKHPNISFLKHGWLQSEENKLLGISPDGLTLDEKIACEVKCPARKKHAKTIKDCGEDINNGKIPRDNLAQCLDYFLVNPKLEILYFLSFRPESMRQMVVKELRKETVVNIGTEATEKLVSVQAAVSFMALNAQKLLEQLNSEIEKLKF